MSVSNPQKGGGLSSGAIGGIVCGILGTLLLISVTAIFYVLGRRNRVAEPAVSAPNTDEGKRTLDDGVREAGNLGNIEPPADNVEVGGRLRYPNDQILE